MADTRPGETSQGKAKPKPALGLTCWKCGGHDFCVAYTRPRAGRIVRSRRCLNCGKRMITWERPAGGLPAPEGGS